MPLSLIPVRLPALPYWAQVAVLAVIYFTTARLGLLLAIPPGNASAVWPPSGIALAAALVFGYRLWPGIWLGATLANAMTEVSLLTALSMGIGNTLESLLGAFLLRRFSDFSGAFERIEQVFKFVLFTCVSSLIAATVGTTGLYFEGLLDGLSYSANWMTWWLGDVVGILVMTPLLLAWGRGFQIAWRSPLVVESLCFYGLLLGVSGWVFGTTEPLAYLLIPFIIWIPFILWAVFRFSQRRLTTASAMVAAIAVGGSIHGSGPFVVGTLHQSLFLLQVFIGFFAVLGFTLSALLRERRQAEASQRHLAAIVESSEDAIISKTLEGIITSWNAGAEKIFGYTAEEVLGRPIILLIPPERQAEEQEILERLRRGEWIEHFETVRMRKDGERVDISLTVSPIKDGAGRIIGASKIARDITEHKRAKQALIQAQKMEAVGQLTGGVAHDFNNLLTIISGNLQLLEDRIKEDVFLRKLTQNASKAATRGSHLVRMLLTFSRRQTLQPQPVNLNRLVAGLIPLLHQTLGEHIEIAMIEGIDLWPALADPTQVETALLNLAINARDAMPQGGKLTLETANGILDEDYAAREVEVAPGEYVMLAVSDNGTGMTGEVRSRAFEPFFTTKGAGRGSGLGLSMVYGFAKQSGGHAKIYSELGQGTTVKLYLPRARGALKHVKEERAHPTEHPPGGEAILVVEDEAGVRELAVAFITELGYRTLEAPDGPTALKILEQEPSIDLLFVDIVLAGGMSGVELAAEASRRHAHLKVLYTSGYTSNAVVHQGRLDEGAHLLAKPYRKEELVSKVCEVLSAGPDMN